MSKGNFIDFIADASEYESPLRKQFLDELYKTDATAEKVLNLLHSMQYDGVSLDDCRKLLIFKDRGPLPCDFSQRY